MITRLPLLCLSVLLVLAGCSGGRTEIPPLPDTTPPVFNGDAGVQSVEPGDGRVTLYFNSAADADSPPVNYVVFYDTVLPLRLGNEAVVLTVDTFPVLGAGPYATGCHVTGLTNDTTYWFILRAADSADPPNMDGNTVALSARPQAPHSAPAPPTNLDGYVPVTNQDRVVLSWTHSTSPDRLFYRVYRHEGTPSGSPPYDPAALAADWDDITVLDVEASDTTFIDGLQPGGIPNATGLTPFSYVVTTVDDMDFESPSTAAMVTVNPHAPVQPVAQILLVDNTGELGQDGDDSENFEHRQALLEVGLADGIDFEIIATYNYDESDDEDRQRMGADLKLDERELLIWFTANAFDDLVLTDFQVGLLADYLDGGGKLIIDGDDVAFSLSDSSPDFLRDYLAVDPSSVQDTGANDASDVNGIIGGVFAHWNALRNEPHDWEDSVELYIPEGGLEALAVNNYPNPGYEVIGIQHHDTASDYYVFFMSIGLEDFAEAGDRAEWLTRIMNWMDVPLP